MKLMKRLDSGRCDFFSLEAIDLYNRPFRFKVPQTLEYKELKSKLSKEDFEQRESNALKKFNFSIGSLDYSSLSKLIKRVEDLSDFSLNKFMKEQVFYINQSYDRIYGKLGTRIKNNIIDDVPVSKDYWIPFLIYTIVFQFLYSSVKKLEYMESFGQFSGMLYRLVAFSAFSVVNETYNKYYYTYSRTIGKHTGKQRLHSIWTQLGFEETVSPFIGFLENEKYLKLFSTSEVNELGDRNIFNQVDRNKIIIHYIKSAINLSELKEKKYINDYFFLHDRFQKDNKSNIYLFEDVIEDLEDELIIKKSMNKEAEKIKKFIMEMQNFGEGSDFLEQSLSMDMKFHCCNPMFISTPEIKDYFGEKIAIMFEFISFYGMKKYYIIWVTLIVFLVLSLTPVNDMVYFKYIQFGQMILISLYSVNFYSLWNKKEKLFAMKYGQNNTIIEFESRINFKGYYQRDLATNQMNTQEVNKKIAFLRRIIIYLINSLLLALSVVASILFSSIKAKIANDLHSALSGVTQENNVEVVLSYLMVILNALLVEFLNIIYDSIYIKMTDFENHHDVYEYEQSLLIKRFAFKFFNTFNSMIIIGFFKPVFISTFGECNNFGMEMKGSTKCFIELRIQSKLYL